MALLLLTAAPVWSRSAQAAPSAPSAPTPVARLVLTRGQALVDGTHRAIVAAPGERGLFPGEAVTTSPGAEGEIRFPRGGSAIQGLGRYRIGPSRLERALGPDRFEAVPLSAHREDAGTGALAAAPRRVSPVAGSGGHATRIRGAVSQKSPGWPEPAPIQTRASLAAGALLILESGALAEVSLPDRGWLRLEGPASLELHPAGFRLEQGGALLKDLGARTVVVGALTVRPGDHLVAVEAGDPSSIQALEGLVRVDGIGPRPILLAPGRELTVGSGDGPATGSIRIPEILAGWETRFREARQSEATRIATERAPDPPRPPELPPIPVVEAPRRVRLSLRDRLRGRRSFEARWDLRLEREVERTHVRLDQVEEAVARDPDNEVKALTLYKSRRRVAVAEITRDGRLLETDLAGERRIFLDQAHRHRRLVTRREAVLGQPMALQTRRGIDEVRALTAAGLARANALTDRIIGLPAAVRPAEEPLLVAERDRTLDEVQRAIDRMQEEIRVSLEPALW